MLDLDEVRKRKKKKMAMITKRGLAQIHGSRKLKEVGTMMMTKKKKMRRKRTIEVDDFKNGIILEVEKLPTPFSLT